MFAYFWAFSGLRFGFLTQNPGFEANPSNLMVADRGCTGHLERESSLSCIERLPKVMCKRKTGAPYGQKNRNGRPFVAWFKATLLEEMKGKERWKRFLEFGAFPTSSQTKRKGTNKIAQVLRFGTSTSNNLRTALVQCSWTFYSFYSPSLRKTSQLRIFLTVEISPSQCCRSSGSEDRSIEPLVFSPRGASVFATSRTVCVFFFFFFLGDAFISTHTDSKPLFRKTTCHKLTNVFGKALNHRLVSL